MNVSGRFPILGILLLLALAVGQPLANATQAASDAARGRSSADDGTSSLQTGPGNRPGIDPVLVARLRQSARGDVSVSVNKSTNKASFVRVGRGGDLLPSSASLVSQNKANDFFRRFGGLFGIRDASAELARGPSTTDRYGMTHLAFNQVFNGVPVFGGLIRAHLSARNELIAINGAFVPDISITTTPTLTPATAAARAIAYVVAEPPTDHDGNPADVTAAGLTASETMLYVYRTGLIRGVDGVDRLVYRVVVGNGSDVREVVFVDAFAGKLVNRYSAIGDALFRRVYEQNTSNQVWQEGDAFPGTLNQDQQNIVAATGHSYYLFAHAFGRDSYDAAGAEMRAVNNDPDISCPNANWNGETTNYCNGVTSDDIVAHEWGHAYTEYTSDLIYQWQPGALNESYSDIWGETVDQINGMGTDAPAPVRSAGTCSSFSRIAPILLINSPETIKGECVAGGALFGPQLTFAGVTGNVVLATDAADATGPSSTDACTAITNAASVAGNIALVDRGACGFTIKVKNAQNAGAIAVVVANNAVGSPITMGGTDLTITIPSVMISQANGVLIKNQLSSGATVNVTLKLDSDTEPQDSYRWLMAEDSTAFGGAIRDMWQPTCLSHPGKVTDAEYYCATTDSGGVHSNSGVPNHGYALLVDGGTYNGHTVAPLGLVKAAHLYWRAQSEYQTNTSGFPEHADALEASCADLLGVQLEGLSTSPTPAGPSGQSISAADCAAVTEMIAAVELRADPAQCNFQPLLAQGAPGLCAGTPDARYIGLFTENFEAGLGNWTLTNDGVFGGWTNTNWTHDSTLPGGRPGAAARGPDPNDGKCDSGAGDTSGVMHMASPAISIPAGSLPTRLAFDHYVATEAEWDGGNLKISINGGSFDVVPAAAFTFNAYNRTLATAGQGNTNPLAGQPGFSGTDGGELAGSWGQSQVDLSAAGVKPGDSIRLRFDMGKDGCSGIDGWYVDDVRVYQCAEGKAPVAVADSYTVTQGSPLNVSAPGVLGNDSDADAGTTLTAVLDAEPDHAASFTLNADGSFSYTPAAGFVGTDSFTYHASDGSEGSNVVSVTILVRPAQPGIRISDATVAEGTGGSTTMQFNVTLSTAYDAPVTVSFATLAGSAGAADFTAVSGDLTIPAGSTSKVIQVTITPDSLVEDDETFTVQLTDPQNATILDATATGTIVNDDAPIERITRLVYLPLIQANKETLAPPPPPLQPASLGGAVGSGGGR